MGGSRKASKPKAKASGLLEWARLGDDAASPTKRKQGATLLSAAEEPAAKRRRQLGRRQSEEQLERALTQHFAHMSNTDIETTRVEGRTVRERIADDMKSSKGAAQKKRLGATYWRELVGIYGDKSSSSKEMKDPSLPVRDALVQGLETATCPNPAKRSIEPLISFMQHCGVLNQKETVGLFKALSSAGSQVGRGNSDTLIIEAMNYVIRMKQAAHLKDELAAMRNLFDGALARQYLRLKKAGGQVLTWATTHMDLALLLVDKTDVDTVIQAKGNSAEVGPQVSRLTSAGHLGRELFGFAGMLIASASFSAEIDSTLKAFANSAITMPAYEKTKEQCEHIVEQFQSTGVLADKRKVTITFFKQLVEVVLPTATLELGMQMWCLIKERSIGYEKGLPALAYEAWLLSEDLQDRVTTIPEELLKPIQAGRQCAIDMLRDNSMECFQDMKKLLVSNASTHQLGQVVQTQVGLPGELE